jgi:hypothetical protein
VAAARPDDEEGSALCFGCLQPVAPHEHLCRNCGAATTSHAMTVPEHLPAAYVNLASTAVRRPRSITPVVLLWALALPFLAILVSAIVDAWRYGVDTGPLTIFGTVFCAALVSVFVLLALRATQRYVEARREEAKEAAEPADAEA